MSDERWNLNNSESQFTGSGSAADDPNIIDSTARVVNDSADASSEAAKEYGTSATGTTGSGSNDAGTGYGSSSAGTGYGSNAANESFGNTYESRNSGSQTGNGNYRYENSAHEYYQSNNTGSSSGNGGGGRKKGFLAVILAIVFGVCVGAGVWGVHRYLGKEDAVASAQVTESAENKESSLSGEKNAETEENAEDTQNDSVKDSAAEEAAQAQQETAATDASETQQTSDMAVAEGIKNEAGLVIADTETTDTELTKMVERVMPSIVSVYNDFTEEVQTFYGQTFTRQGESTGSGFIIGKTDTELLIVTNNHVVEGADHLRVLFIDEETCDAEIKGTDPSNDLAVIAVSLSNIKDSTQNQIKVATLGNSDNLKIGEDVVAIGNALGYGQSVTTGIVSANNREISDDTITGTFIQTDAAINPGNSGGALVNMNGYVIGINSSKIGGDAVEGMGFAIPISRAIPIIEDLMSHETLSKVEEGEQGTIGISGATVTSDVSSAYNMPQGVYVAQILENGGAANSDLHEGDIITAINGQKIQSMEELQKQLQYYKAGTEVTLTVQRQDGNGSYKEVSVKVTLGTRESIQSAGNENTQNQQGGQSQQGGQPQQGGQNGQNGYNNQSESDQETVDPSSILEQFGFPFGY